MLDGSASDSDRNADGADIKIRFIRVWHIRVIRVPIYFQGHAGQRYLLTRGCTPCRADPSSRRTRSKAATTRLHPADFPHLRRQIARLRDLLAARPRWSGGVEVV